MVNLGLSGRKINPKKEAALKMGEWVPLLITIGLVYRN